MHDDYKYMFFLAVVSGSLAWLNWYPSWRNLMVVGIIFASLRVLYLAGKFITVVRKIKRS